MRAGQKRPSPLRDSGTAPITAIAALCLDAIVYRVITHRIHSSSFLDYLIGLKTYEPQKETTMEPMGRPRARQASPGVAFKAKVYTLLPFDLCPPSST